MISSSLNKLHVIEFVFEVRWNWSNSSLCVVRASNYTGMRVFGRVIDSVQRAGVNDVLCKKRAPKKRYTHSSTRLLFIQPRPV